jgi:hypothetical protein
MIIIPASRPSVSKWIASSACSWSIVCEISSRPAPTSAIFVRSNFSEMISARAPTKIPIATAI